MKKILSLLLVLTIVLSCLPLTTFAAENTTEFMGGDGTEENPYLISNKRHLNNIRLYPSAHFLLLTDITFTESDSEWEPISNFYGVIDGADHTINGLRISAVTQIQSKEYGAGFILQNSGTVRNLHLRSGTVAIAGFSASSGKTLYVGVFAAQNSGDILNCTTDTVVNVTGTGHFDTSGYVKVGGLIGDSTEGGLIDRCINSGAVTAEFAYPHGMYMLELRCGGIAGSAYGTKITNCGNTAPIYAYTKDALYVGGITGSAYNYQFDIDGCYNTGDIYARAYKYEETGPLRQYVDVYCSGIAGNAAVNNSYNTGKVEGYAMGQYDRARCYGITYGDCSNCYNVGAVTGTVDGTRSTLKIGAAANVAEHSYYLENVVTDACEGVSCTQDALQKEATFVGFDFENVWSFDAFDAYAYPKLKWQIAAIKSVSLLSKPENPIVVTEGLEPDFGNITVYIERTDGHTKEVPLDLNMLPDLDIHRVGAQVVPVVYNGVQSDDTIAVNVVEKQVAKIEVVTSPDRLAYFKDQDALDLTGGQVKISYNNNTEETRSLTEFQVTGFDSSRLGEQTLTVVHQGQTAEFNVVVYEIASISMDTMPGQLRYYLSEEDLSVAGGRVEILYTHGKTQTIDLQSDMVTGFDKTVLGKQTLTVSYQGYETTYDVYVYCVSDISIERTPAKTDYVQGQPLNVEGGTIRVNYTEGKETVVLPMEQASVSYDTEQVGEVPVTVNYKGKETVLYISVSAKTIANVQDFVEPQKLSYYQGESLDLTGGSLYVTYVSEDGYSETIPLTESMISGYDKDAVGFQTLTITYHNFSQTFMVRVIEKKITGIEMATLPDQLTYEYKGSLDVTGGTICVTYNSGETETVALNAEMVSGFDSTNPGTQILTVSYGGQTCTFEVFVQDYPKGDINKDSAIDNDDVVLLLWHTLFPTDYPIEAEGDLNRDGSINNDDVVLLLWHTLFPEDYPIV